MRNNGAVSGREYNYDEHDMLVSATDLSSIIQYCNPAFVEVSGFEKEDLIGQPHNVIRHPDMPPEDVQTLYDAMQSTLRDAIARADGVSASELKAEKKSGLRVHGRTGEPCPVCGETVRQVIYSDSTFQYCPTCQTGGKPLADRVLSRLLK